MSFKLEQFKNKILKIYPERGEEIIEAILKPYPRFFRENYRQGQGIALPQQISFEKIAALDAYKTYDENISRSEAYLNNQIYIQDLSSMLPVIELDPKPGEKILDLCAAPGSKTTQIASITRNEAEITAIEENRKRFFKLKELLEANHAQVKNVHNLDGTKLTQIHPEYLNYFDKVLVDVPCSSEGQINLNDSESLKFWNKNKFKKYVGLQKRLLEEGFKALKPGGTLVYSTCTFSVEENEGVVNDLINKYENVEICKCENIKIQSSLPGFSSWKKKTFNKSLANTVRIIPDGEFSGFYIAKITN